MNFIRNKHKSIHFSYLGHPKLGGGKKKNLDSQKKILQNLKKFPKS